MLSGLPGSSFDHVGRDGFARFDDVADIGFAVFIERRRHADDDGFGFLDLCKINGRFEFSGIYRFGDFRGFDMLDVTLSGHDGIDLLLVHIQSQHVDSCTGKLQAEWQSYVTESYDRDFHVRVLSVVG